MVSEAQEGVPGVPEPRAAAYFCALQAVICAISAVYAVDYKTAEEKYIKGPSLSYR